MNFVSSSPPPMDDVVIDDDDDLVDHVRDSDDDDKEEKGVSNKNKMNCVNDVNSEVRMSDKAQKEKEKNNINGTHENAEESLGHDEFDGFKKEDAIKKQEDEKEADAEKDNIGSGEDQEGVVTNDAHHNQPDAEAEQHDQHQPEVKHGPRLHGEQEALEIEEQERELNEQQAPQTFSSEEEDDLNAFNSEEEAFSASEDNNLDELEDNEQKKENKDSKEHSNLAQSIEEKETEERAFDDNDDDSNAFQSWPTSPKEDFNADSAWTANFASAKIESNDDKEDFDDDFDDFASAPQTNSASEQNSSQSFNTTSVSTKNVTRNSLESILNDLRALVNDVFVSESRESEERERDQSDEGNEDNKENSLDPESSNDKVWLDLCASNDSSSPITKEWSDSESHSQFLQHLHINKENVFEGTELSRSRPLQPFAQASNILQPTVINTKSDDKSEKKDVDNDKNKNEKESSVPSVEFDWRSSGLEDPLQAASETSRDKDKLGEETKNDEAKLRAEAQKIVDSFPLLNFMRSPTLLTNKQS